jgi:hypothetical protein
VEFIFYLGGEKSKQFVGQIIYWLLISVVENSKAEEGNIWAGKGQII